MRKIINDPVHGFITIDDELIYSLIAHPYFQRLRRIKQMALAYLVYPGAVHTRLHHALGAYHLMYQVLEELKLKKVPITKEEEQAVKIAILLHDIGHGPFSHALEHSLVNVNHEYLSLLIMQKLNEEFDGKLTMAIEIFKGNYQKKFLHQLVSSQLDMDRLDYLARDSFFTGVSEGIVGYDRIIKMMMVEEDEILIEEKGIHSVEKFLIARRLMYWQVYLHKTVMSSELMLLEILKRAKYLVQHNQSLFATPALSFFLKQHIGEEEFSRKEACLKHFIMLDDTDISSAIKVWCDEKDELLSTLCRAVMSRKLFKLKFIKEDEFNLLASTRNISNHSHSIQLLGSVLHQTYNSKKAPIRILYKDGSIREITEVENPLISRELTLPTKKYYICSLN